MSRPSELCVLSHNCFTGTSVLGQFGKLGSNVPNHVHRHIKSTSKSSTPHLTSNEALFLKVIYGFSYTCLMGIQALRQFWETGPEYPQIIMEQHMKKIQSLQLHIKLSFTLVPRPSVLSCPCFTVIWVLGQFGETGPKYSKSSARTHTQSNPEFSASYVTLNEVLHKCQSYLRVELYLFQGIWVIMAIWGSCTVP